MGQQVCFSVLDHCGGARGRGYAVVAPPSGPPELDSQYFSNYFTSINFHERVMIIHFSVNMTIRLSVSSALLSGFIVRSTHIS